MNQEETVTENVTEEEIQQVRKHILQGGYIEYIDTKRLQVSRDRIITQTFINIIEKNTRYEFDGVTISNGKLTACFSKYRCY
jgi:hypothetical protein